jgi:hypothetical protein
VIVGGCRCGACRYTLAQAELPPVYCCHCLDCQSWSGSAFVEQALIAPDVISAAGPVVVDELSNPSGSVGIQRTCGSCRSRLWSENAHRPGMALLRAGTLDRSEEVIPRAHIWVKRKQHWLVLPDDVAVFDENAPPAELISILLRR